MKSRLFALATAAALALTAAACTLDEAVYKLDAAVTRTNANIAKYAPIVGKDLVMFGNILVTAECSPLVPVGTQTSKNVLEIVAPNAKAAEKVSDVLSTNQAVATELCPLVEAIQASVGKVPVGQPTQVVTLPAA